MARKDAVASTGNKEAQIVAEQIKEIESLRKRKTKQSPSLAPPIGYDLEDLQAVRLERLVLDKLMLVVDSLVSVGVPAPQKDKDTGEPHNRVSWVEEGSDVSDQAAGTSDSAAGRRL